MFYRRSRSGGFAIRPQCIVQTCMDLQSIVIPLKLNELSFFCFLCVLCGQIANPPERGHFRQEARKPCRSKDFFMSFVFLSLLKVCLSRCKYSIFIISLFCGRIDFSYFMPFMIITHSKKDKMSQTVILQTFYKLFTFILHVVYKLFTRHTYLTENQDDTFCLPRDGISGSNMPPFRTQKAAFCKVKGHLLQNTHVHARKK